MYQELISRIRMLIEKDKFDLAQEKIIEGLGNYPDSADMYALQAELHYRKDEYKKALISIEKAIAINPENDYSFYWQSRIYLSLHSYKKADTAIDMAINLDPDYAAYYGTKAAILLDTGKAEQAIAVARRGLEADPEDLFCNNILSIALNKTGEQEEAGERLKNLLENDPENLLTHANMGYHYLRQGNVVKAKEHFANSLRKDPGFEYARGGMMQAIKSTNPLYRKLLQFSFWMEKIGATKKWMLLIGLILVVKVIPVLAPFYLVFVLWTWFTGPISDIILYFDKYGRYLMTKRAMKLTLINITLVALAIISVGVLAPFIDSSFFGFAFALFVSVLPVYLIDATEKKWNQAAFAGFAFFFIGVASFGVIKSVAFGDQTEIWGILIVGMVIFSWVASLLK